MAEVRIGGYPKRDPSVPGGASGAWTLTDWRGNVIGRGSLVNCSRIQPGARGSWISNERCSYRFKVNGQWYACRGYGEGMAASCRVMKPASVRRARLAGTRHQPRSERG